MQIIVTPASPKTGAAAIQSLLADKSASSVVGVYRDPAKAPQEFISNPRFKAVKGNLEDGSSLDFSGADAVMAITPPLYGEGDMIEHARTASENTRSAIEKAGSVKRLVLLSSVGAQLDHGTGEILTNHTAESILKDAAPEVVMVRCSYFMENWATSVETVKSESPFFFSTITPLDYKVPMVAVKDIGRFHATQLLSKEPVSSKPKIYELQGPKAYTPLDVQKAFADAVGKDVEIKPVEKDKLESFFSQFFPASVASQWAEMAACFLPGGIMEVDLTNTENVVRGDVELADAVREMLA